MIHRRRSRGRSRRRRGVTLFEVLIVVAILALITAGVAVVAFDAWVGAQEDTARSSARSIRMAAETWWIRHDPGTCPTVETLILDGALDRGSPKKDPWGTAWKIECEELDATVVSCGRDRQPDTPDDIRVPPPA
jgi:prepilin-type N-terminal cleavage/methylation domain-containing protein